MPQAGHAQTQTQTDKFTTQWWLTPGAVAYHFEYRDQFNQTHPGLGIEYHFKPDGSLVVGTYKNSNYRWSQYVGVNWTPISIPGLSFAHLGVTAQMATHYDQARDGNPFAFAAPVLALEGERFGANIYVIPTIRNVTGAVALQLKFRFY